MLSQPTHLPNLVSYKPEGGIVQRFKKQATCLFYLAMQAELAQHSCYLSTALRKAASKRMHVPNLQACLSAQVRTFNAHFTAAKQSPHTARALAAASASSHPGLQAGMPSSPCCRRYFCSCSRGAACNLSQQESWRLQHHSST